MSKYGIGHFTQCKVAINYYPKRPLEIVTSSFITAFFDDNGRVGFEVFHSKPIKDNITFTILIVNKTEMQTFKKMRESTMSYLFWNLNFLPVC